MRAAGCVYAGFAGARTQPRHGDHPTHRRNSANIQAQIGRRGWRRGHLGFAAPVAIPAARQPRTIGKLFAPAHASRPPSLLYLATLPPGPSSPLLPCQSSPTPCRPCLPVFWGVRGCKPAEGAACVVHVDEHLWSPACRRRDCHSAAPPSPFSRCFNGDGERASAEGQSRRRLARPLGHSHGCLYWEGRHRHRPATGVSRQHDCLCVGVPVVGTRSP